jgi:hypothetical protein
MKKITKRDVFFFFMGLVTLFFLDIIFNWEEAIHVMMEGFKDGSEAGQKSFK